ncbi:dnaJ domain-containing protein [Phthorimaea operculella]|nr:dnaJ domain-containing protein [Phthorimaea operculella]
MYNHLRHHVNLQTINTLVRCYSLSRKSHYDVLGLRKNCTEKDIKDAFIKLSKEYHPDKNKDANAQQHFVRIVEAYNVLSKSSSRSQYDHTMQSPYQNASSSGYYRAHSYARYSEPPPNYYNYYYEAQQKRRQNARQAGTPYYGDLGVMKIPKYVLVLLCFGIATIGTVLQVFVIREMYVVQKRQALERSRHLSEELDRVRQAAEGKTNEMQTRLLLERIVGSANPTIATASLGQALAAAEKDPKLAEAMLQDFDILSEISSYWPNHADTMNEIKYNDILNKLRMYSYYYYYSW